MAVASFYYTVSLQCRDSQCQRPEDLFFGHSGLAVNGLLRKIGDMDETDPDMGTLKVMKQGVKYVVAYEGTS